MISPGRSLIHSHTPRVALCAARFSRWRASPRPTRSLARSPRALARSFATGVARLVARRPPPRARGRGRPARAQLEPRPPRASPPPPRRVRPRRPPPAAPPRARTTRRCTARASSPRGSPGRAPRPRRRAPRPPPGPGARSPPRPPPIASPCTSPRRALAARAWIALLEKRLDPPRATSASRTSRRNPRTRGGRLRRGHPRP